MPTGVLSPASLSSDVQLSTVDYCSRRSLAVAAEKGATFSWAFPHRPSRVTVWLDRYSYSAPERTIAGNNYEIGSVQFLSLSSLIDAGLVSVRFAATTRLLEMDDSANLLGQQP